MAANNVLIDNEGTPLMLVGEQIYFQSIASQFSVESGTGYPGSGGNFYGKGIVYLTNYRVIFLPDKPSRAFSSFSIALYLLDNAELKSPLFGSLTFQCLVTPVPNGGLRSDAKCQIVFVSDSDTHKFMDLLQTECKNAREVVSSGRGDGQNRAQHLIAATARPVMAAPLVQPLPSTSTTYMALGAVAAYPVQQIPLTGYSVPIGYAKPAYKTASSEAFIDPSDPTAIYIPQVSFTKEAPDKPKTTSSQDSTNPTKQT